MCDSRFETVYESHFETMCDIRFETMCDIRFETTFDIRFETMCDIRFKTMCDIRFETMCDTFFRCRHLLLHSRPLVRARPCLCWICRRVGFHHHWFHSRPWQLKTKRVIPCVISVLKPCVIPFFAVVICCFIPVLLFVLGLAFVGFAGALGFIIIAFTFAPGSHV